MKRIFLIFSGIILTFLTVQSQDNMASIKPIRIGLMAAPSIAWMKPSDANFESDGVKFGSQYGLATEFYFTDNYGLATGVNIVYNGGKLNNKDAALKNIYNEIKYKLQYLELPLSLKMRTNPGFLSFYGQFGLGLSFALNAKGDYKMKNNVKKEDDDLKNDVNIFRGGFVVGGGVEISLGGSTTALAGVTFNNGLSDILKGKDFKSINNYISLNLGILF